MELLRQRSQGLGQKRQFLGVNGDLAGLGLEDKSLYANDIADIHALEFFVGFLAQIISGYIDLNTAFLVLHVAERSLAHDSLEHHTAGDGDSLILQLVKIAFDLRAVISLIIFNNLKRILSGCLQLRKFLSSDLLELGCFLNLLLTFLLVILCHFLPPYCVGCFSFPLRLKSQRRRFKAPQAISYLLGAVISRTLYWLSPAGE